MKKHYSIVLFAVFVSFLFSAFSILNSIERVGNTQLNGLGCVCHSFYASQDVHTWFEGPTTLHTGETANYKVFLTGGPAFSGGYNVAARFGTLGLLDSLSILHWGELTQRMALPFPSATDTIFWEFSYTAPDSVEFDTLYAASLSIDNNGEPDSLDLWNFSPKFPIRILPKIVPVELTNFSGSIENYFVILNWKTASEKNNFGFEIEESINNFQNAANNWEVVGFVKGNGTTLEDQEYSFSKKIGDYNSQISNSEYSIKFRLKQIDFDGSVSYSNEIPINFSPQKNQPENFELFQNYPNPFNPSTVISYQLPASGNVSLKIYDVLGNEVATLINEEKQPGNYNYRLTILPNGTVGLNYQFQSGVYFYELKVGNFTAVKKFILLK